MVLQLCVYTHYSCTLEYRGFKPKLAGIPNISFYVTTKLANAVLIIIIIGAFIPEAIR